MYGCGTTRVVFGDNKRPPSTDVGPVDDDDGTDDNANADGGGAFFNAFFFFCVERNKRHSIQ